MTDAIFYYFIPDILLSTRGRERGRERETTIQRHVPYILFSPEFLLSVCSSFVTNFQYFHHQCWIPHLSACQEHKYQLLLVFLPSCVIDRLFHSSQAGQRIGNWGKKKTSEETGTQVDPFLFSCIYSFPLIGCVSLIQLNLCIHNHDTFVSKVRNCLQVVSSCPSRSSLLEIQPELLSDPGHNNNSILRINIKWVMYHILLHWFLVIKVTLFSSNCHTVCLMLSHENIIPVILVSWISCCCCWWWNFKSVFFHSFVVWYHL